jgi:hypothetical protein
VKLNMSLVPRSEEVCSKSNLLKKLISGILATLIMTAATLSISVVRAGDLTAKIESKPSSEAALETLPPGLTRNRPAFRKAMEMLADGAAANPSLAGYYHAVTKRIKGESPDDDSNPIPRVKPAGDAAPSLWNDIIALGHVETLSSAEPAPPAPTQDATPAQTQESSSQSGLTAGDMDFKMNPAIKQWTKYYTTTPRGLRTLKVGLERSNAYLDMARAEFRKAGVPEDLVWLAFVESVWNPKAVSPAAAGGLWQFIPPTAREYGLKVQSGDDERSDPAKQTRVAAEYLHDLYAIFGSWELSMAAYNGGEPRVMGAIVKAGAADFWSLYDKQLLPKETCDYVPKILASIRIVSQPEVYGLKDQAGTESTSPAGS